MKTLINEKIRDMVGRIAERFSPDKIILFGSHAKGQAGADSDADLLVVMPVRGSRRQKAVDIGVSLADFRYPIDIIVVTPEDVARYKDIIGTIIYPAVREGAVLYERKK